MASHRSPRLEKGLLSLLLLTLLLPLPLTAFVHFTADGPGFAGSLRRLLMDRVSGDVVTRREILDKNWLEVSPLPMPTFADLRTARYQETLARRFNEGFAGREWIFQCTQEAYIHLFNTAQGPAVLGRHHSTFFHDPPYDFVGEYSVERLPADTLDYIVKGLRLWRDSCLSRGVGFAIVITPSKASVYPEDLPAAWQRRHDPRSRAYDNFVRLLQREQIRYVDGHLLTLDAKKHASAPVFPLGGTHWEQYSSLETTNALLRELAAQGQPVRPIENTHRWVDYNPLGEDSDMTDIIQPLFRWTYPVNRITYPPVPLAESRRPSLTVIGGSFVGDMGLHLYRSQQFSEIHWLRYYREAKETPDFTHFFGWNILSMPIPNLNVEKEVYPSQCLVLEVNEQQIPDPLFLRDFFDDTLNRLPGPGTPKAAYPYEAFLSCRWNEPISFAAGAIPAKPGVFSGLFAPEAAAAWSDGPDTTMRLTVPSLEQEVILSVDAGAFPIPNQQPVQRVSVFANDQPVAEWTFDTGAAQKQEAVIPRAALADGRLILRFHYAQTISPAQISDSKDTRQLAVLFGRLSLRQRYHQVDGPVIAAADAAKGDPVYAVNFSEAQPFGRWTTGSSSILRLPLPPAGVRALTLSADVGALIDAAKLPVQRTSILVNGQPVGDWVFFAPGTTRREVDIPPALLTGDPVEVQFRFSKTISPAEVSKAADPRQLALLFANVQLHWLTSDEAPVTHRVDGPVFSAADAAQGTRVYAANFSEPQPFGRFTVGPSSTVRLPVPPSEGDLTLSAKAGALIIPPKLTEQHTTILVHGQPIGEWVFLAPGSNQREVVIPRRLLTGNTVDVEFRFSRTISPAENGQSEDQRQLALVLQELQLHWFAPNQAPPAPPAPDKAGGR